MIIQARKLLSVPAKEMWNYLTGDFELQFDNKEIIQTNAKLTIISSFFWDMHRAYPNLPIRKEHHIQTALNGKRLKANTHYGIVKHIKQDWENMFDDPNAGNGCQISFTYEDRCKMLRTLYESFNNYYNECLAPSAPYMTGIDLTDMVNLVTHPKIVEIREKGDTSQVGIKEINKKILDVIINDESMTNNKVSKALRGGLIKGDQLAQSIGPYGYPSDIDDTVFRRPILRGYIEGLRSIEDGLKESRTASVALYYSLIMIKKSEYFSRKLQIQGANFKRVVPGNCGTPHTVRWEINNATDLKKAEGTYYVVDGQLKCVSSGDKHLIGTVIKRRDHTTCIINEPGTVCATCFGKLAKNLVGDTNVGHQAVVILSSGATQTTLSAKHFMMSNVIEKIRLAGNQTKYFITKDGYSYHFNPELDLSNIRIIMESSALENITAVLNSTDDDMEDVSASRISEFSWIKVRFLKNDEYREEPVKIEYSGRKGHATMAFLLYMKTYGYELDNKQNYIFDMSHWDKNEPLFDLSTKKSSIVGFSKEISKMLESSSKYAKARSRYVPTQFSRKVDDYITQRFSLNNSVVNSIVYSAAIVDREKKDYSLPKPWTNMGIGVLTETIANRSICAALAFQNQANLLVSPESFLNTNRQDHFFDYMFVPEKVKQYNQK